MGDDQVRAARLRTICVEAELARGPATARPRRADATTTLTRRESEVLDLLRDGLSNADIATRHHNSVRTIEHHVSAILTKLGLRSRAEAAAYAASLPTDHRHRGSQTEVGIRGGHGAICRSG
jgi:DNA-binding NarL/FixJ family response regulator